ncbi:MAG: tail fiber domain-containing protein [Chloroflexota bacterium]
MKRKSTILLVLSSFLLLFLTPVTVIGQQVDTNRTDPRGNNTQVEWRTRIRYESAILTITGPNHFVYQREFPVNEFPSFESIDESGIALQSGTYTYEIQLTPYLAPAMKAELVALSTVEERSEYIAYLTTTGQIPDESDLYISGYLSISDGKFLSSTLEETSDFAVQDGAGDGIIVPNDQQILDDLIVGGSICAGLDCVNGESFGFDTLRLKENNLRIRAVDTSNSASFPSTDWQITFNESTNGGMNKFSIEDITAGRIPFTIEASAPSHSLYVDDGGRIGIGTSTPVVDVHVQSGNTPTVRLEQDGSSGFSVQTWDMAGNEANFFIRDTTNGSELPFRIYPAAPTNSLAIEASGDVGVGTNAPDAPIHIVRSNGTAQLHVQESAGSTTNRTLIHLENNGSPNIRFTNNVSNVAWESGVYGTTGGSNFVVNQLGSGGNEFRILESGQVEIGPGASTVFTLTTSGNLIISGTLSDASSRGLKENFVETDESILHQIMALPIYFYNYKADDDSVQHVGPTSEDFADIFGVGADNKHISPRDLAGVAVAAVQELNKTIEQKNVEIEFLRSELVTQQSTIEELESKNEELEARLAVLEAIVLEMAEEETD